ncbi:PAS domain S-box protein [Candidatus Omnitrophota bacterium]
MNDNDKSREQLISELDKLKKRNTELEGAEVERKLIIDVFKKSEKRFREIIENSVAGYCFINTDGIYQQVNNSWLVMHGYRSPEEVIGKHYSLSFSDSEFEKAQTVVEKAKKGEKIPSFELARRCKDGTIGYTTLSLQPVFNETIIIGVEGIFIDITEKKIIEKEKEKDRTQRDELVKIHTEELITVNEKLLSEIEERKRAQEELLESEERFRQLSSLSLDAIAIHDKGVLLEANDRFFELFGYKKEELIHKQVISLTIAPESRDLLLCQIESGSYGPYVATGLKKDGSTFPIEIHAKDIVYQDRNVRVGIIRDITHRIQTESALLQSEKRYKDFVESTEEIIMTLSASGELLSINKKAADLLGYTHDQIIGKNISEIFPEDIAQEQIKSVNTVFETGVTVNNIERKIPTKTGYIWGSISLTPVMEGDTIICVLGKVRNITLQKEAEDKLIESEERFRTIIENTHAGYFFIDRQGCFRAVNDAWLHMHKYDSADEIIGNHFSTTQVEHDMEKAQKNVETLLEGSPVPSSEFSRKCRDGTIGYHTFTVQPVEKGGEIVGLEGFLIDVTEKKKTVEELKWQTMLSDAFLEALPCIAMLMKRNSREIIASNRKAREAGAVPGTKCHEALWSLESPHPWCLAPELWESGESQHIETEDHGIVWDAHWEPVDNEHFLHYAFDITDRKKAEENLILLSSITQQIDDSFIVTDSDFNITYINNAAEKLFGYSLFELVGKPPDMLNAELNAKKIQKDIYKTVSSGKIWQGTHKNRKKDGSTFLSELKIAPLFNSQGDIFSYVSVQLDVTERIHTEEKIRASLEEKELLLREIHHRVKNNMQVISSLLTLQAGQIKNKEYFHIFHESINRIKTMSLIHTMLYQSESISKIKIKHYLPKLCYNLTSIYKADWRGIDINYKISDIILKIDTAIPCGLIINELISNSLKHAFPGDRKGSVNLSMRNVKGGRIRLTVSDNGVGLPENMVWKDVDSIGLHLVKILAEGQLQGDIDVKSSDKGTKFLITFER